MSDWQDPRFKVAGWVGFALFLLVIGVDLLFNQASWAKTFSQYVVARSIAQPLFGLIVLGLMIFLIFHWFYRPIREWIRRWTGV